MNKLVYTGIVLGIVLGIGIIISYLVRGQKPKDDSIYEIKENLSIHGGRLDYLEDELRMILETIGKDLDE